MLSKIFKQEDLIIRTYIVHSRNILKHFEGKIFSTGYCRFIIYDEDNGSWSNEGICHHEIIMKYANNKHADTLKYADQLITNVNEGDECKPLITLYNNAMKSVCAEAQKKQNYLLETTWDIYYSTTVFLICTISQ
jgi:hypothetical protein